MTWKSIFFIVLVCWGAWMPIYAQNDGEAGAFLWLEAKALLGSTPTVNNLIFVPGVEVQARYSFFQKESIALSAGTGFKHFRGINGVPFFGSIHFFPKPKKENAQSWFAGTTGYTYAWQGISTQTRDKLRGGWVAQIEWGRKIHIGKSSFGSFSIGYEAQQITQKFSFTGQETRLESLFYHFLTLGLGFGK